MQIDKLNMEQLEVAIQERDRELIVDFYATWCGPCVLLAKELEQARCLSCYKKEGLSTAGRLCLSTCPLQRLRSTAVTPAPVRESAGEGVRLSQVGERGRKKTCTHILCAARPIKTFQERAVLSCVYCMMASLADGTCACSSCEGTTAWLATAVKLTALV